jgi:hypothetical protein
MEKNHGTYPIQLSKPVPGRAIANAVKATVEIKGCKAVCEIETRGTNKAFQIGQSSDDRRMELRIEAPYGAGWTGHIELAGAYDRIRVVRWDFITRKYRASHDGADFRDPAESFRDRLMAVLDSAQKTDPA